MGLGLGLGTGRRREGGEGVREHQRRQRWRAVGRRRWEDRRRQQGDDEARAAAGSTKIAKHNREEWDSGVRRRGGRNEGGGLGESASGGDTRVRFSWDGARAVNGPAYFPCRAGPKHVGRLWRPNPARGSGRAGPGTIGIGPCRAWAGPKTCRAACQMGSPRCLDIYNRVYTSATAREFYSF